MAKAVPSPTAFIARSACSYLGEALRAVLVLELRTCRVSGIMPCDRPPANLPEGCVAVRCHVRTTSGAATTVVLGGPASGDETGAERLATAYVHATCA